MDDGPTETEKRMEEIVKKMEDSEGEKEPYYFKDPKKALKHFFEREGMCEV